jgi:hypothetical protein
MSFLLTQDVDARDIGEPSGLAFGKHKGELDDAVLRTAMRGHDGENYFRTAHASASAMRS